MKLRIGTRGSDLALAQAHATARALRARGHEVELTILETKGDADQTSRFEQIGSAGLFVREIERALLERRVDLAVHSYKDLPSQSPSELMIAAVPKREDPRDRLLVLEAAYDPDGVALPLKRGVRVGTAAARRTALLKELRPDLVPTLLRGNVPTRVRRLREGGMDAILLASAGLDRLDAAAARGECARIDRAGLVEVPMEVERWVPAPSQGALALQVRAEDQAALEAVSALDEPAVRRSVSAERELLALIQAGCDVPFGAHCRPTRKGDELELLAALEEEGAVRRVRVAGADPRALARAAFEALLPERARP